MQRIFWVIASALLLVLLTACPQQVPEQPKAAIAGYVINSGAGEAVADTTIYVYDAGTGDLVSTVASDVDGSYLVKVPEGTYDLKLQKEGYAGSQVLNVRTKDNYTTPLNIIQRKAFNPEWPTTPPNVSLEGVADGEVFDAANGFIPYRIASTPADNLDTTLIYAALGKTPGSGFVTGLRDLFQNVDDTGMRYLDPLDYAAFGDTTFQVVVYDNNGNRTQLIRYITVAANFPGGNELVSPELRRVLSVTLGKNVGFYRIDPQTAPTGGNLFVYVIWEPKFDYSDFPNDAPAGYRIYRSFDGENYAPIATVNIGTTLFIDSSPDLEIGKTVYYKVSAFVGDDESEPSNALSATPLDIFSVNLLSPADYETNVPTTPTFSWEMSDVGNYRYVGIAVWDTLTGQSAILASGAQPFLVNRTSYTWNEDGAFDGSNWYELQSGRSYEWEAYEAYAVDDAAAPTAVSVAADGFGLWFPYGIYGVPSGQHFTFTTAP